LLKSLQKQIEKDGKTEQELYESFVCWGKSLIAQKTDSNSAAQTRSDALSTYISDVKAGSLTLTTEGVDLQKEIETYTKELSEAKEMRDAEKTDYDEASKEMNQAVSALSSAIEVMTEAAKDDKASGLLAYRTELNSGIEAVEARSAKLNSAVELGERFLSKSDFTFLKRVLTGDTPVSDEKDSMLKKKASFKKSYKTRSASIEQTLAKIKESFGSNLEKATEKEAASQAEYEKLSASKGAQLAKAEEGQLAMGKETAAREVASVQATAEVEALKTQVSDDSQLIAQTTASLDEKKNEWDARSKNRMGELTAVSEVIGILYSDSLNNQRTSKGVSLLQRSSSRVGATTLRHVIAELKKVASVSGDGRLSELAALIRGASSASGDFTAILTGIDEMLQVLKDEEVNDLETKEGCEKNRMANSRQALLDGREIDEKTDEVKKLESEIEDLDADMKATLISKQQVREDLDAATTMRTRQAADFKVSDSEDTVAAQAVQSAIGVLENYYASVSQKTTLESALVQKKDRLTIAQPKTWEGDNYGGRDADAGGILAILGMIHSDIIKDQSMAQDQEKQAQQEFVALEADAEKSMADLQEAYDTKNGQKGDKQVEKTATMEARLAKFAAESQVIDAIKAANPECEYYTVNFKLRASNRNTEVDGLNSAKAILQGGSFKK
jgi:hypothetical protein